MTKFTCNKTKKVLTGVLHDDTDKAVKEIIKLLEGVAIDRVGKSNVFTIPDTAVAIQAGYWILRGKDSIRIMTQEDIDANYSSSEVSEVMSYQDQQGAFANELESLILRYTKEFDLNVASIIGTLECAKEMIFNMTSDEEN